MKGAARTFQPVCDEHLEKRQTQPEAKYLVNQSNTIRGYSKSYRTCLSFLYSFLVLASIQIFSYFSSWSHIYSTYCPTLSLHVKLYHVNITVIYMGNISGTKNVGNCVENDLQDFVQSINKLSINDILSSIFHSVGIWMAQNKWDEGFWASRSKCWLESDWDAVVRPSTVQNGKPSVVTELKQFCGTKFLHSKPKDFLMFSQIVNWIPVIATHGGATSYFFNGELLFHITAVNIFKQLSKQTHLILIILRKKLNSTFKT